MSYTPHVNFDDLTCYLGICAVGVATASSTTLSGVSFGTSYYPNPGVTFEPSDVGMPIAIVGGGPVNALMPPAYFVQGALFHTTIATYVSPTEVTLAAAPDTSISNTGFATIILFRPIPMASDVANLPSGASQFQYNSSIAPGTSDTLQFSTFNSLGAVDNAYVDRFGAPKLGQPVYLHSSDTGDLFGGYIDTLTTSSLPGVPGVPYAWSMQCASWMGLAKRREVSPAIPQTFEAIDGDVVFSTIVFDYLSDDGVDVSVPSGLATISLACPVGANIGQLLDQVVSLLTTSVAAYYWTTDPWRVFVLGTRGGVNAPWNVADGSDLFAGDTPYSQSITATHNQMANQVYAIGSAVLLNTLNATIEGDGTSRTFNLPAPVGAEPTITLNSASQTVGVLGVDVGFDWYWSQGSAVLTQDSSGTILVSTDVLVVTYTPEIPGVAQAPNATSLQQLQAVEGTSAEYDYSFNVTQPILPNDLLSLATAYEIEYGMPATTVTFYTLRPGLAVGQLQPISLPDAGISGSFLIATIQMTTVDNVIVWQYTAFGGANIGNAITALVQFINRGQATGSIVTPTTPIVTPVNVTTAQHKVGTPSFALTNPVAIGDLIVVVLAGNNSFTDPPAVTDTLGNTYVQAVFGATPGGLPNVISILWAISAHAGTVTISSGVGEWMAVATFQDIDQVSPVDTFGTSQTVAPALTLTGASGDVVFTALVNPNTTPSVTAPEVALDYEPTASQPGIADSYQSGVGAGSFTSSLLAGASVATQYASVAFRIAAISPPAQTTNVLVNPQSGTPSPLTTKGDVWGYSTGNARIPIGSNGDVLTADSTQTLGLKWAPGGGGSGSYSIAESHTATVGTTTELDFVSWYDSSCDLYEIYFEDIVPSTTGLTISIEFSTNGGTSYDTSTNYSWSHFVRSYLGSTVGGNVGQTSFQFFPYSGRTMVTGSYTLAGKINMYDPGGTNYKNLTGAMLGNDSANASAAQRLDVDCWYTNTAAVNAFRVIISGGTFGGTVRVYKLAH